MKRQRGAATAWRRALRWTAVATGFAAPALAAALELGPLQLHRLAGQAPYAEVPLLDAGPIDPANIRARLATPDGYRVAGMNYIPALRNVTITPQAAPNGRVVLRLEGLPNVNEAGEIDLLLLVGDRVSLSLNEYRVDLRSLAREFPPGQPGSRLASQPPAALPPAAAAPRVATAPAAAPATAPAMPAPAAPPAPAALDAATASQVNDALAAWAQAWSARNVEGYLAAYVADYAPPGRKMSHDDWAKLRRSRIVSKQSIEVALSDVQLSRRGDVVLAQFQQRYRGDSVVENGRKRIAFRRDGDRWLIQEEVELR